MRTVSEGERVIQRRKKKKTDEKKKRMEIIDRGWGASKQPALPAPVNHLLIHRTNSERPY